jgi:hypothetical protein
VAGLDRAGFAVYSMAHTVPNPSKDDRGMKRIFHSLSARGSWTLAVITALTGLPGLAHAQYQAPPPPAAWAAENVTLVNGDGTRRAGLTLVVRGGLIETLGEGASLPADARVLEGDSLVLYAGLVDAHGGATVSWPEARDVPDPDQVRGWDPPRSRQGFLPHRRVADHLSATGWAFVDQRRAGVVASLIHADGGMAPGQAAVVVHREAATPWELVHDDDAGLSMSLRSAGGVYPSQLFGVLAYLRQAFLDAERYETMREATARGTGGFLPPGWDPDFEALRRAVRGEVRVHFQADSDEDIRRALDLADEAGFRPVIVGGREAWKLGDELARRQVPVLVSLDFPRAMDWDPEADTIPDALDPSAAREKERLEAAWSNAGRLEAAGVTFALTSGGGEADLLDGARKAVEYGLSPAGALRALTVTPSELLGLGAQVAPRQGGPATFLLTEGELLDEDSEVRFTFVEGRLTEGAAGNGGGDAPAGDLTGTWTGEISVGGQGADFTLELTQSEDGRLSGTMSASQMPTSPVSGSLSGSSITLLIEAEGLPEAIRLTGTLAEGGERMSGGGSAPFGQITFDATRRPGSGWAEWLGGAR